jgi:acetyl esterase/lipase
MKKSRHLVDPELARFLENMPSFDLRDEVLPEMRRVFDATPSLPPVEVDGPVDVRGVVREEVYIPGPVIGGAPSPDVRIVVYRPAATGGSTTSGKRAGLLHLHGGGFVLGTPERVDRRNKYIAADIGCVVASVDYRLAPETPFPGPVEDCYASLLWLHRQADALGIDPSRIAVKGESAGGGLAACLALLARDREEVALSHQFLVYPMLDDRTASASEVDPHAYSGEFLWTRENNRYGWRAMLGGNEPGGADVSPYCAAARAKDLRGLPATFLQVGSLDLFVEENVDYARRLLRAGVPTELHVYPGGFHGLDLVPDTTIKKQFARDSHLALRRALGNP